MVHGGAVSPARRVAAFPGRAREAMIRIIAACLSQTLHTPGRGKKRGLGL